MSETDINCPECGEHLVRILEEYHCYECGYRAENILQVGYDQNHEQI